MPNWSENNVEITGPTEDLKTFLADFKSSGEYKMTNLHPVPSHLSETETDFGSAEMMHSFAGDVNYTYTNKHDWIIANWGTKWDLNEVHESPITTFDDKTSSVTLSYLSAWSPNFQFYLNISRNYPTLTFVDNYFEEGNGFIGEATILNGKAVDKTADIETQMYVELGAITDEDGYVDWDNTPSIDLTKLFPLDETMWDVKTRTAHLDIA